MVNVCDEDERVSVRVNEWCVWRE